MEALAQLGITHRRTAYHHPEGNSYIERFHRSLKEEEVWTSETAPSRREQGTGSLVPAADARERVIRGAQMIRDAVA